MLSQLKHALLDLVGGKDTSQEVGPNYALPYWRVHNYFLWSVIADRIRSSGLRRVLDIGCGPGQVAACLFDMASIDSYVGLDFSAEAIGMARRACSRALFVVGDARKTGIHAEVPHDLIVCTEVLDHMIEDEEVLRNFTPGKRCICSVTNFPWESHVRHFEDIDQVIDRYGPYFERLDVHPMRLDEQRLFYLMDGIRNSFGYFRRPEPKREPSQA